MFEMKEDYIEKKSTRGTKYIETQSGEAVAKECTKCGEIKLLIEFGKRKEGVCGRTSHCKLCRKPYFKKYREENSEKIKEYFDSIYDQRLAYNRERYKNNEWVREKHAEIMRKWRNENYEFARKIQQNYKANNIEKTKEYNKKWEEDNRELRRTWGRSRRVKLRNLPCELSFKDELDLKELQDHLCLISGVGECTDLATKKNQLSIEHFIPVEWGIGGHIYENCYYMFLPLNKSKRHLNPFKWILTQPEEYQKNFHDILVPMMAERNLMSVEEFTDYVYQCEKDYLEQKASVTT